MADLVDYWLTFRIETVTVGGVTSATRREALYEAVESVSSSLWVEPTSFILFDSIQSFNSITAKCKSVISEKHDLVLIRQLNTKDARVIGKVKNSTLLKAFMPYLTVV